MHLSWFRTLALVIPHVIIVLSSPAPRSYDTHHYYVVEHTSRAGVDSRASVVEAAQALGVEVVEQVGELQGHWLVRAEKSIAAREPGSDSVLAKYASLQDRADSQSRSRSDDSEEARDIVSAIKSLSLQVPRQRTKRAPPALRQEADTPSKIVAQRLGIQDPLFSDQWHLVNDEFPEHSMNATGVWDMGLTGKGVISSLIDDGLDYTSEDLADNFDADDSYDYNDHEDLPTPKLFDDTHGTRCAGQIAAVKNTACGIGIAYNSKVAGVRILSGRISDADEAAALNYGYQNVSIYSCSWGPSDDGRTMAGPSHLIKKAMLNGINKGRAGKGSIFVFASGNGAASGDQCNFDGYTNSIYSVTVSAVDHKGMHPYYSEPCAANMIVAYSSGGGRAIVTTDKGKSQCATTHGGTSAAAPNAVGVFALALEARPDLTWRDIQYLCVQTARTINPDDPDWEPIAQGRLYSYKYGFGALDAYRFVTAAQKWQLVKPQTWLKTATVQLAGGTMTDQEDFVGGELITSDGVKSVISVTSDQLQDRNFEQLEHINVRVWISHQHRGDVEVEVVSPNGVRSVLAGRRNSDNAHSGFPGWTFMTVKHWGENPIGDWTIRVSDPVNPEYNGTFIGWDMMFWGSSIDPSKAQLFELPPDDEIFPPHVDPPAPVASATTTKTHTKPTAHLPDDHGTAEGENSNPAFPSKTPVASASPSSHASWFPDMATLASRQKWFFGAIGGVSLLGIGVCVLLWRRRAARRKREHYLALAGGDDLPLSTVRGERSGSVRLKEGDDAFGVGDVSDDDDADEETRLRPGPPDDLRGSGLHSGLLDDDLHDDRQRYRDDVQPIERGTARPEDGSSSGSGDGSWEHAS